MKKGFFIGNVAELTKETKGYLVGSLFDEKGPRYSESVQFTGVRTHLPGDKGRRHIHDEVTEYWLILSGSVILKIRGDPETITVPAGWFIAVFPGTAVGWKTEEGFSVIIIKTPSIPSDIRDV